MSGNGAQYFTSAILNWIKGTTFLAAPTNLYLALYTSAPTAVASTGTEVAGGSYARVAVASATDWSAIFTPAGVPRYINNLDDIVFPTATADWGTVGWWGLNLISVGGNKIYFGAFDVAQAVPSGRLFKVLAGQLKLQVW